MARRYQDMLEVSQELLDFEGYMSSARLAEKNQVQARFDNARRVFVYQLYREGRDRHAIWPSVEADLVRLEREGRHADAAYDYVRDQLRRHVARQLDSHQIVRFAIRWGPPAAAAVAALVYAYVKAKALYDL